VRDYTIIIPSCTGSNLRVCLGAIKIHQSDALLKVLVYDTDSKGEVESVCEDFHVTRVRGDFPFIYSRAINTCVELCPGKDVILLNDDATLKTQGGFDTLHRVCNLDAVGIVSAGIHGFVGNPEQLTAGAYLNIREAKLHTVAFVCVHILHEVLRKIGSMDERLIHYGWDDNLYCLQTRAAGYGLGIYDGCVVEHGTLPSTYRKPGAMPDMDLNQRIFEGIVREKNLTSHWPIPFKFPTD
jgi:GT2 family glycosyltransferase